MTAQPPPIDPRDRYELIKQTTELAQRYSDWRPDPERPDPGQALIGIFARFAELVVQRINRAPERNYLAFLSLIGTQPLPPLPARVPLTFSLAERSQADAVVPAGTQVAAAPLAGEQDEVVFETDTALVVTPAQLRAVVVGDTENDSYRDRTTQASGEDPNPFPPFVGDHPVPHQLFVACDPALTGPGEKTVTIVVTTPHGTQLHSWRISWAYWDGTAWQSASPTPTLPDGAWRVRFTGLPQLPVRDVNGISAGWLRAQLDMPLPPGESGLAPESVAVGSRAPQDEVAGLFPFGATSQVKFFYLSADETIATGSATVNFTVALARPGVVRNAAIPVQLVWSYKVGSEWKELGRSSSQAERLSEIEAGLRDGSLALTRNGDISFRAPQQWPRELYYGRYGRWLRVEIAAAGGAYATLPQLASLTAGYAWDLPTITGIAVQLDTPPQPLAPPAAFADNSPLDVTKDFYPFGEEPRFNDTFFLACPETLARPGTTLELSVRLTNATAGGPVKVVRTDGNPKIAWEVWDGAGWRAVAVNDKDYAFTNDGVLRITLPTGLAPTSVNGAEHYWLRARLASGHYGVAATYREKPDGYYTLGSDGKYTKNPGGAYEPVAATFAPPVIAALSWLPTREQAVLVPASACVSFNDFSYTTHRKASGDVLEPFTPFTPGTDHDSALYLGFDQPFDPRPVTLYLQVEPPDPEDVAADQLAEIDPATRPQLVWEYSGPAGWQPLAALDETEALAGRGLVQFVGPGDLLARECFGQRWWWLRLRWQRGMFAVPPRLRRVLPNTTWATQASTVSDEILGSGTGDADQVFTAAQIPVLAGQQLVVREAELPEEAAALETDAVTVTLDDRGQPDEIWVRWHPVADFYRSGPLDRHYTVDPINGEIRFGDGQAGRPAPRGQNNIRITYRTDGGAAGNRAAETITTLKSAVPYVDAVTNHEPAQGGAPQESIERLYQRGPRVLRHRDRAVTAQDLEDIAFEASAEVVRVRAVLPSPFDPFDLWLDPEAPKLGVAHRDVPAGRVGMIVVPDSAEPRPAPSLGLLRQVHAHLRARMSTTAELWVAGPEWIRVTVTATVVPRSPEVADPVRGRVRAALEHYLHPLTGGPDGTGWAFGRKPHRSDLFAVAEAVEGVDHVRSLDVAQVPESEELGPRLEPVLSRSLAAAAAQPPASDLLRWLGRALVYSGPHAITVTLRG
ncbi:MAG: putative baseplate assembly protein [Pseudonocardiales bacterium]